ncbi:unnamed protein product [Urochloa decumbens]|uniref:Uncharacterized protein n=1 Tax=Urochloa decumbens TaxID=240449 RepID=A0ABC9BW61_9POAL
MSFADQGWEIKRSRAQDMLRPSLQCKYLQLAQETLEREALEVRLRDTNERLEARISMIHTRIHRFPHTLRGIGGVEGNRRYVEPSVVAIGPYHHAGFWDSMEEVKHAAAYRLLKGQGRTVEEVYKKVLSVAGAARRCYDDASPLVAGLSDAEFVDMMFVDGCFLVWYLKPPPGGDPLLTGCAFSYGHNILKDILRLENQIPLPVLEALMDSPVDLRTLLPTKATHFFFNRAEEKVRPCNVMRFPMKYCRRVPADERSSSISLGDSKPPHLLGLLRSYMISGMPRQKTSVNISGPSSLLSRSAVDLAQIGVKLTASTAHWFADMKVQRQLLCGDLSLSSLSLGDFAACCLVNMAALETAESFDASSSEPDAFVVSSYLSLLTMLMDREEDVHELRMRGVLRSTFSNAQTLAFFKELGQYLQHGYDYRNTKVKISEYIRQRPVRTAVHKFVYNNHRIIVAVLSIAGALVGILKALYYSLNKP